MLELSVPLKGGKQSTVFLLAAGDTNGQIEINGRDDKSSTQTTEEVTEAATEEITGTEAEEEQEHPDIDSAERQSLPLELGLMGIYKCNSFIKGMFLRLCAVLILMLTGLYFAAQYFFPCGHPSGETDGGHVSCKRLVYGDGVQFHDAGLHHF